jgi:hypothetical protein
MTQNEIIRWKTQETLRSGLSVYDQVILSREEFERRVGAGTIDGLRADVDELRDDAAGAVSARADRSSATLEQNVALGTGAGVVGGVRAAIRQVHPSDKALQRDFGVGMAISVKSVSSVVGGLRIILDAAAEHPEETRAAGILEEDIQKARDALASLAAADNTQEGRKVSAREATARRRATQVRVEAAIAKILAAAHLAFMDDPTMLAKFTSLVPSRPRGSRKPRTTTGPGTTTGPAKPDAATPA